MNTLPQSVPFAMNGTTEKGLLGFCGASAEKGESVPVIRSGFFSPEHGDSFYDFMDQIAGLFISKVDPESGGPFNFGAFHHFLVVLDSGSGEFSFYKSKIKLVMEVVTRQSVNAGDPVFFTQIGDIRRVLFEGIDLKENQSVIYFFSVGWRHGLYFDFRDLRNPTDKLDIASFQKETAKHYLELIFPRNYRDDPPTTRLMEDGWFPFLSICGEPYNRLYNSYRNEFHRKNKDRHLLEHFGKSALEDRVRSWWAKDLLLEQKPFIESGLNSYLNGDYIGCISTLYPRIEGILRKLYLPATNRPNVPGLLAKLREVVSARVEDYSLFRYSKFIEYLEKSFFKGFDLATGQVDMSRHAAAHGVAAAEEFTQSRALVGFLILDQLFFYL